MNSNEKIQQVNISLKLVNMYLLYMFINSWYKRTLIFKLSEFIYLYRKKYRMILIDKAPNSYLSSFLVEKKSIWYTIVMACMDYSYK